MVGSQGVNSYAYVRNNPLRLIDPTGLDPRIAYKWPLEYGCPSLDDIPNFNPLGETDWQKQQADKAPKQAEVVVQLPTDPDTLLLVHLLFNEATSSGDNGIAQYFLHGDTPMSRSITAAMLVTCLALPAAVCGQGSLPDQTLSAFRSPTIAQLRQLTSRFGIKDDWRGYVCQDAGAPELVELFGEADERVVAIKVSSSGCQAAFLLTYWYQKARWLYGGTVRLDESYGRQPRFRARRLIPGQPAAIVVDSNLVTSGTGMVQENMQIYMLLDGRIRAVFNQPVHYALRLMATAEDRGPYAQTRDSVFEFPAVSPAERRVDVITEKRNSSVNGQLMTEYFAYGWDPRLMMLTLQPSGPR